MVDKKILLYFAGGLTLGLVGLIGLARVIWHGKYYPGVVVASVNIGGSPREEGKTKLATAAEHYSLTLTYNGAVWEMPKEIIANQLTESANAAYRMGRRWKLADYVSVAMGREEQFPLQVTIDEPALERWVDQITQTVEIPPLFARVEIAKGKAVVINGSDGVILDRENLEKEITARATSLRTEPVEIPMMAVKRQLTEEQVKDLGKKAEALIGDRLEIVQDDEKIILSQDKLVTFLVDEGAIGTYVDSLATQLKREPQDAVLTFEGGKVKEFAPSRDGVEIEKSKTVESIKGAYAKLIAESKSEKLEVTVVRTAPKITTDSVNDLGINERIGRGESYYAHSIANRVYNVGLASGRVSGALVPPGEEFSFNKFVGEISGATGYKTAYVISGGRTVLGDGGGVCQVSTTLFRATMDAGLPITERWPHAYRVGYYEQNSEPGIDATVYSPSKDFKFKNDTPGHVLVQAINDPKNLHLVFEIYGTKDGRIATVSKPVVSGVSPPPPDIYEDDPNLPAGTLRQVDWAAWGAKASFNYKVEKDGQTVFEKTYVSNYRPWADIFIRGTGPVTE